MFILILILVAITVLLAFLWKHANDKDEFSVLTMSSGVLTFSSGITVISLIAVMIFAPLSWKSDVLQFKAFESTLANARSNKELSEYERAAIQSKIADWNEWLADVQYRNTWLVNAVPDDVDALKPIK